ncbi:alcohol dehydrogenase catalytic domain-containing protein [Sunxiuqinia dokdonensis]|uniref:Alcohol dehydrogenase-like N-terminal domain-containing protein n=1 Tax=Sunxiuqinia dokdonensis TaxID=1409788 RepID=A0A0L8VE37_9BACT|nr:alcohol dehydrogenase catalytic domain-containing protein [Sunxiuqinia dokdonensis]KOH46730.1 hypothetical protein NC99_04460 [Sunxiuqinia dokdonensis]
MKAIGFKKSLAITEKESFIEFETAKPTPEGYDLLVKIAAISVNPVDFKVRQAAAKDQVLDSPKIIGWDAVGTVEAVGGLTSKFRVGDQVYYAGDLTCSSEYAPTLANAGWIGFEILLFGICQKLVVGWIGFGIRSVLTMDLQSIKVK